jgi:DNA-directed RNA polymerase specialized sigma24 family protein
VAVNHDDEDMLNSILSELQRFVRRLGLPVHQHHLYDDIIQETLILVHRKWAALRCLNLHQRTGWACNALFNVTRNTNRAELRQTQAWQRLTKTAFENVEVKEYFDGPQDDHTDILTNALNVLSVLDRKLLVDHVWAGRTITELATSNNLTETAVRHRLTRARQAARRASLSKSKEEF